MKIDDRERQQLIARWQSALSKGPASVALDHAVASLIDEACRGVGLGRISAERCAIAGEAMGRAWHALGEGLSFLVDELAAVRRSIWDTTVERLRFEGMGLQPAIDARLMIDLACDVAVRRAVAGWMDATPRTGPVEVVPDAQAVCEAELANVHTVLADTLRSCEARDAACALLLLRLDVQGRDDTAHRPEPLDVVEVLASELRRGDRSFSLSEEDFAVVCTDTDARGAGRLLERILDAARLFASRAGAPMRMSGGLAVAPEDGTTPLDLIRIALADREFSGPDQADLARV